MAALSPIRFPHPARLRAAATLAAWCVGLWLGWLLPAGITSTVFFVVAALVAGASLAGRSLTRVSRGMTSASLLLSVLVAGVGWSTLRLRESPADALAVLLAQAPPKEQPLLRLTVLETPRLRQVDVHPTWLVWTSCRGIVDDQATTHPASGNVWLLVSAESKQPPFAAGDRVIARGSFRPLSPARNPGDFDTTRWAHDRGVQGSVFARSVLSIRPDESPQSNFERAERFVRRGLAALRQRASAVVDATAGDSSANQLVRGLLLGEDPSAPLEEVRAFYRVGLAHILTVSGFHLAVFAGAVLFAVRLIGDLGRWEYLIVAASVMLFLVIVPPGSPTTRAAVIVLALLAAKLFGRRYDRLTLLLWTALLVLLVRPSELWALGFQLSFGMTAALLGLTGPLQRRLFPPRLGRAALDRSAPRRATSWWQSSLAASLVCWLVSAPWLIVQLGVINPLALIAGLLVTPLISALLCFGYAAILVGMVLPMLAAPLGRAAAGLARLSGALVVGADAMPGASVRVPWVSPLWGLVATAAIVVWLIKPRLRRGGVLLMSIIVATWLGVELAFSEALPQGVRTRIARLDTGPSPQRCTLVRTQHTSTLVGTGYFSARSLSAITRELGASRFDTLVLDAAPTAKTPEIISLLRPARLVLTPAAHGLVSTVPGISIERVESLSAALASLDLASIEPLLERTADDGVQIVDVPQTTLPR